MQIGYRMTLQQWGPPDYWESVYFEDDASVAPNLGTGQVLSEASNPDCYLHQSSCGDAYCDNNSVAYWGDIKLNWNGNSIDPETGQPCCNIQIVAQQQNLTVDQVIEKFSSHELGHIFDLSDDYGLYTCYSPTIMNEAAPYACQFYGPQQCNVAEVISLYSGWTIDAFCG